VSGCYCKDCDLITSTQLCIPFLNPALLYYPHLAHSVGMKKDAHHLYFGVKSLLVFESLFADGHPDNCDASLYGSLIVLQVDDLSSRVGSEEQGYGQPTWVTGRVRYRYGSRLPFWDPCTNPYPLAQGHRYWLVLGLEGQYCLHILFSHLY
jgi:hypothetical protein